MKKNKLEDLENTLETKIESAYSSIPINVIGQAFYGRSKVSKKDGSYTSTLWYVLFYLPLIPVETFRILDANQMEKKFLPKVFALDEYIPYDRRRLDTSYIQIITTLITVWTMAAALVVLTLAYPAIMFSLGGLTVAAVGVKKLEHKFHKHKSNLPNHEVTSKTSEIRVPPNIPKTTPQFPVPAKKSFANEFIVKPVNEEQTPTIASVQKPLTGKLNRPIQGSPPIPDGRVEGLWDDLLTYKYIEDESVVASKVTHQSHFIEVLGYINFMLFPVYFFLYVFLVDYPDQLGKYPLLKTVYSFLTTGNFISILSIIIGFIVISKNKVLGFFLLLFSISIYFDLHIQLWVYLNTL